MIMMDPTQRRLFLLVFLWTCLCLYLLRTHNTQINEPPPPLPFIMEAPPSPAAMVAPSPFPTSIIFNDNNNNNKPLSPKASSTTTRTNSAANSIVKQQQPTTNLISSNSNNNYSTILSNYSPKFAGANCHYDYPSLLDLQFNNIHWQKMSAMQSPEAPIDIKREHPESGAQPANYFLYNAYFDDRWRAKGSSVRILAMIDRNDPPDTNCLLWSRYLQDPSRKSPSGNKMVPVITRAQFVYAWYPKWGNHHDGMLQPWIVTCPIPKEFGKFVPDSISLVQAPDLIPEKKPLYDIVGGDENMDEENMFAASSGSVRRKRGSDSSSSSALWTPAAASSSSQASIIMPPGSSSLSPPTSGASNNQLINESRSPSSSLNAMTNISSSSSNKQYDCKRTLPITNNLPVFNVRPQVKQKFAVCVKGLDFPNDDLSIRLVEWIELLNLLGASKIFLYNLNVHENISRVLHYYKERGIVELIPLTLPGDQPNLPEYQHAYLKNRLTTKRQNELIPYNDCLYRNLYAYEYLALLDIDEIIMPLKHHTWFGLMEEVERVSLMEQNYSRASYNTRNVYFFDDLMGPMGTTTSSSSPASSSDENNDKISSDNNNNNLKQHQENGVNHGEQGIPHYLHMMQHVYRSKNYTKPGQYVKCFHNTERVVSLHNHFPMNCFGQCTTYSIPTSLAHLQHYRRDCVGPLKQACKSDFRLFTTRDTTIWKYKQQMIRRATRVLNHLDLLAGSRRHSRQAPPDIAIGGGIM